MLMGRYLWVGRVAVWVTLLAACGFPRPADVDDPGTGDSPRCVAGQALRCDGNDLVRCNGGGTPEVSESCSLGCDNTALRCKDVSPSNALASSLDATAGEADLDLGTTAVIST